MRIYLPCDSTMQVGGGFTFRRNLEKAAEGLFTVVSGGDLFDVALVSGATMVSRETWRALQRPPGKVVLRVDGVPEDGRNRGTGWPRLRDFAARADAVVYQSRFIRDTVGRLLGREGAVIYNGVDLDVFNPDGARYPKFGHPSLVHVNFRDDPNKRVEEVIERFRQYKLDNPGAALTLIGNYPKYIAQWGFGMLDFEEGRDWQHVGVVKGRAALAMHLRSHDYFVFPSYADPCPNTLIEALACGLEPMWINDYGGAAEIVAAWDDVDWSLERMGREYLELFERLR